MLLLVPVVVITALSLLCSGSIQRHPALWYFLSGVIAVLTSISVVYHDLTRTLAPGVLGILQTVSFNGYLSFAFFILVMFAGALNPRRKGVQRLLRIRAQLSIIACILVLPHVVLYLINIISSLHFILNMRGKVLALYAGYLLAGVAAFAVMLPLFITSFKKIRQKMRAISWKKLQKWAYLFYVLIFAHAICVVLLSSDSNWLRLGLYTVLLAAYLICKWNKSRVVRKYKHSPS